MKGFIIFDNSVSEGYFIHNALASDDMLYRNDGQYFEAVENEEETNHLNISMYELTIYNSIIEAIVNLNTNIRNCNQYYYASGTDANDFSIYEIETIGPVLDYTNVRGDIKILRKVSIEEEIAVIDSMLRNGDINTDIYNIVFIGVAVACAKYNIHLELVDKAIHMLSEFGLLSNTYYSIGNAICKLVHTRIKGAGITEDIKNIILYITENWSWINIDTTNDLDVLLDIYKVIEGRNKVVEKRVAKNIVRQIAHSGFTDEAINKFEILSRSKNYEVRAIAAEAYIKSDVLIKDPSFKVRASVARSGYGLDILMKDKSIRVVEAAKKAKEILKEKSSLYDVDIVYLLPYGTATGNNAQVYTNIRSGYRPSAISLNIVDLIIAHPAIFNGDVRIKKLLNPSNDIIRSCYYANINNLIISNHDSILSKDWICISDEEAEAAFDDAIKSAIEELKMINKAQPVYMAVCAVGYMVTTGLCDLIKLIEEIAPIVNGEIYPVGELLLSIMLSNYYTSDNIVDIENAIKNNITDFDGFLKRYGNPMASLGLFHEEMISRGGSFAIARAKIIRKDILDKLIEESNTNNDVLINLIWAGHYNEFVDTTNVLINDALARTGKYLDKFMNFEKSYPISVRIAAIINEPDVEKLKKYDNDSTPQDLRRNIVREINHRPAMIFREGA